MIPVRNDAERLRRCLASIVRNDYPRELIELIVVDNDSTDGSAQAAREFSAIVIKGTGQQSVAALRNKGARAALGSVIAFADSDHEISRNWIDTAVDVLASTDVAATGAPCVTQPSPNWVQQQYDGLRARPIGREDVTWLGSGNMAVKRSAFESVNGFNPALTACEDVDLCNRLRVAGHRIVADPNLHSIHFGDPRTLKAVFFGELWRGRDNLRVTFSGPRGMREWRSALIPIGELGLLTAGVIALLAGRGPLALACWLAATAPSLVRAAGMVQRQLKPGVIGAAQALAVAVVFDLARALAIVARGSHRARRVAQS